MTLSGHEHHARARTWFDSLQSPDTVWFCRTTQQSLLRLLSNAAVHAEFGDPPLTNEQAWSIFDEWLLDDRILLVTEPEDLENYWREYSSRRTASTKLWMDAYLAAFARADGYRFVTTDAGFRQYRGLDLLLLTDD